MSDHTTHLQVVMEEVWGEHLPPLEVQQGRLYGDGVHVYARVLACVCVCVCVFSCSVASNSCDPMNYSSPGSSVLEISGQE